MTVVSVSAKGHNGSADWLCFTVPIGTTHSCTLLIIHMSIENHSDDGLMAR